MIREHVRVAEVLIELEGELRAQQLWDETPPPASALASTQPFAFDTLTLPQWLQHIFLPRMRELIEAEAGLPGDCAIAPVAEEYFAGMANPPRRIVALLQKVDRLLSDC